MMYKLETEQRINKILKTFIPINDIDDTTKQKNFRALGIDSLEYIKIIVELEKEFNIDFSDEMLLMDDIGNINELCELVEKMNG